MNDAEPETAAEPSEATGPPTDSVDEEPADRDIEDVISEAEDIEERSDADESVAAATDTSGATGSVTDTESTTSEHAAEPSEAAGPSTGSVEETEPDTEGFEAVDEPDVDESEEADQTEELDSVDESEDTSGPVTSIKGIGPAYSDRLNAAGISSVAELADADAEALSDEIDVSPKIVGDWIDRAANQ